MARKLWAITPSSIRTIPDRVAKSSAAAIRALAMPRPQWLRRTARPGWATWRALESPSPRRAHSPTSASSLRSLGWRCREIRLRGDYPAECEGLRCEGRVRRFDQDGDVLRLHSASLGQSGGGLNRKASCGRRGWRVRFRDGLPARASLLCARFGRPIEKLKHSHYRGQP